MWRRYVIRIKYTAWSITCCHCKVRCCDLSVMKHVYFIHYIMMNIYGLYASDVLFCNYLVNGTIFDKYFVKLSQPKKKSGRHYRRFSNKVRVFCPILTKLEYSWRNLAKIPKFRENPSSGRRVVPYGRADRRRDRNRHDEANVRFPQLFY